MFGKLKEKLTNFKKSVNSTIKEKRSKEESVAEKVVEEKIVKEESKPIKEGIGKKIKSLIVEREVTITDRDIEKPLEELEFALLESDVALVVVDEILQSVREELVGKERKILDKTGVLVENALKNAMLKVLSVEGVDFDAVIADSDKPVKILFVGVNGTGKTTCIAKITKRLTDLGNSVVIASGDTYRAGAIEQIEVHAKRLGVKVIQHEKLSDPAAVIFDAVKYADAKRIDVVLADTAGRFHTNVNLMDQLKKIQRVIDPDLVIFVDEAIAGNDAVERAQQFNEAVGIDGSILTKTDADSKGGAALSIAHCTSKPILFLGTGQEYTDIVKFEPAWFIDRIFE
ncbi:MAG: Signal recognition particle 54 kDa protein [Candidatus Syntrophoarchaeum sp. GoM_oil]|nr:MAG: Signal recognition particle 54 kDa protein [Candidatus Syntrophoarchaeum sp. GoM_oil]